MTPTTEAMTLGVASMTLRFMPMILGSASMTLGFAPMTLGSAPMTLGSVAMPLCSAPMILGSTPVTVGSTPMTPGSEFIPALMKRLNLPYYAGLLSAAQYHGAAHHRPQEFQVFLAKSRRPIHCGAVRVSFMVRKRLKEVPVQSFNTPRGTVRVTWPSCWRMRGREGPLRGAERCEICSPHRGTAKLAQQPVQCDDRQLRRRRDLDANRLAALRKVDDQPRINTTCPNALLAFPPREI